jgi:hypothetical protein
MMTFDLFICYIFLENSRLYTFIHRSFTGEYIALLVKGIDSRLMLFFDYLSFHFEGGC